MSKILLVNDLAGYGKVALSVMIPVFSHLRCQTFNLPTALVSNTLDYGKFDILDTTRYMENTLAVWEQLDFSFDAICTGLIVSEKQANLLYGFCSGQRAKGTKVFVDPIMGDQGKLYNGVDESTIGCMRKLCSVSDVIVPNITEACFLSGQPVGKSSYSEAELEVIISGLLGLGARSVVITSVPLGYTDSRNDHDAASMCTIIREEGSSSWIKVPYVEIPVMFPGTGDIFASILTASVMNGLSLEQSVRRAMTSIERLIVRNQNNGDKYKGIPIEQFLDEI